MPHRCHAHCQPLLSMPRRCYTRPKPLLSVPRWTALCGVSGGSEITVAKPMHLKSKHTTLSPYAKIVTSRSLASGTLAHHPLHRTQRRRRELGRRTASRESADSLPPRATLFLTTSNFSEEPGLAPPPEAIEHPPLQAAIGTDRVSRLEGHTAIKARGCALVLNYRN